ncbi:MAG TPA: DNA-directed RNA polymerase subunit beta' [Ktedonobacterales bacterium]|nr:DNA-directed RNA polymerase subunit beta' [Ktedonobacterales bacterium]
MLEVNDFDAIRVSLASPEQIRSWSYGEVIKPETINYRTLRPEKDGLFCERIFGPTKDWECACGKYKRVRFKGIVCDKCGVEVARAKVRRERMGHIELASPVSHIWYFKGTPSRIGLLLDLSPRNLERILYFALYVVTSVNDEARELALGGLEESIQRQLHEAEQVVTEQILEIQQQRDERIAEIERERQETQDSAILRRDERIAELRAAEAAISKTLRENASLVLKDDIVFEPTGEVIARQGQIAEDSMSADLERMARELREQVSRQAQDEADQIASDAERNVERAQVEAEGRITSIQDDHKRKADELRAGNDTQRRKLEALKRGDLLQEAEYRDLKNFEWELRDANPDLPELFEAGMGAEAVQSLLEGIDLEELAVKLRQEIAMAALSSQRRKKGTKRLNVVEAFRKSDNRPEWMIMTVLPVLPPDLRPMVQLDGGRFATSDLNDLYRRVINRNNRLKRLLELGAPEIIIRNEKRMLQEACDALIDNGRRGRAVAGSGNHKLKSLSDMLKGKQGRFRQNLLGKRVDYSGRSVIVVGPDLKLHQCGLPKRMALELFKPFVMRKLVERGLAHNIKSAKRFVERVRPEVWDVLEEVIHDHPVLLNRAPTLHRLGIQAFEAVLVEGSAIQLHPLVCPAFNADFDGDQMAVHVPLSERAQEEARTLMLSSRNILSPAHGEPSIGASQEMVLGCYYMTMDRPGLKGEGRVFTDATEAELAYDAGVIALRARIKVRLSESQSTQVFYERGKATTLAPREIVETTVGRIIFNDVLPERLRFKNYAMNKENLRGIIAECFKYQGRQATADLADAIKRLGFTYATKAGASVAISDVVVPEDREAILSEADNQVERLEEDFREGLITDNERYRQSVNIWLDATDRIEKRVREVLDPYGSIYTIANSGATKAKFQQIRQLSGMRGLMADPSGRIMEIPVRGNFRDGLNVMEYFISSHGARKGLADTALRTAESGYLTRRLIDVAQDVIVLMDDCGTTEGIWITEAHSKDMNEPFKNRMVGRILAAVVPGFEDTPIGTEIDDDTADAFIAAGVKEVYCRSVLQCAASHGVCRLCYGRNLAAGELTRIGDAVGIIGAQSIGEPGTQLTMRTFHTGGIAGAQEDITQGLPRVEELFEARTPKEKAVVSEIDGVIEVETEESGARKIRVVKSQIVTDEYELPKGTEVLVAEGDTVVQDQVIARATAKSGEVTETRARTSGVVVALKSGKGKSVVVTITSEDRDTREYPIPAATNITVANGERVRAGQQLTSGLIDPQDVLRIQGREAVHLYLVKEVQKVYRSTGVYINDKHIEIIVRQMLRRVRVEEPGDTDMLPNDLVDRFHYEETNARALAEGGEPATAQTVLLGVTKASLNTSSFLAAASFQETTRVLTEAAISGATDHLRGLKENVIIGKLIPAGTGLEQRRELRERQRAERLAAMTAPGLGTLGLGGTLGEGEQEPYDGDSFGDLPIVDSLPE